MTKLDFSAVNNAATKSFNAQRNLIKRIGKGETILCTTCKQPLTLSVSKLEQPGVTCQNGCTNIALELDV